MTYIRNIDATQITEELKKGFEALIVLTQISSEFKTQIKQVEKWQKNKK